MNVSSRLDPVLPGIPSLRELTQTTTIERVTKCLSWREAYTTNRDLGGSFHRSTKGLVTSIYDRLYMPCQKEAFTGTRWYKSANDEEVTVGQYMGDQVPMDERYMVEQRAAMTLWSLYGRKLTVVPHAKDLHPGTPDILVAMRGIDGVSGTLGATTRRGTGDIGSVTIPGYESSVLLVMDIAEIWNPRYFYTVFVHELGHALGHGHYGLGNWMYARYRGTRTLLGSQDLAYHGDKYGRVVPA